MLRFCTASNKYYKGRETVHFCKVIALSQTHHVPFGHMNFDFVAHSAACGRGVDELHSSKVYVLTLQRSKVMMDTVTISKCLTYLHTNHTHSASGVFLSRD